MNPRPATAVPSLILKTEMAFNFQWGEGKGITPAISLLPVDQRQR